MSSFSWKSKPLDLGGDEILSVLFETMTWIPSWPTNGTTCNIPVDALVAFIKEKQPPIKSINLSNGIRNQTYSNAIFFKYYCCVIDQRVTRGWTWEEKRVELIETKDFEGSWQPFYSEAQPSIALKINQQTISVFAYSRLLCWPCFYYNVRMCGDIIVSSSNTPRPSNKIEFRCDVV